APSCVQVRESISINGATASGAVARRLSPAKPGASFMRTRTLFCALLSAFVSILLACSGASDSTVGVTSDAGVDATADASPSPPADAAGAKAPPSALPHVPNQGGGVIAHVKLVTITFAGFPYQSEIQAFGDWIVGSQWLQQIGAEYGVGTGTHIAKLVVDYTPPAVVGISDIEQYIATGISMGVFPQPDHDTLYVIY